MYQYPKIMAKSYHQIFIHFIFAMKNPNANLVPNNRKKIHWYLGRILEGQGNKLLAINSMDDHIHILAGIVPSAVLSDVVREMKCNSSRFINNQKICPTRFSWQQGYLAFSYSMSQVPLLVDYIASQNDYHKRITFEEECMKFLERFEIDYKSNRLFNFFEEPTKPKYDKQIKIEHKFPDR